MKAVTLVCCLQCYLYFLFVFLLSGYQRELTYKRDDGSYSAFGKRDSEGNMWYALYHFVCMRFRIISNSQSKIDCQLKLSVARPGYLMNQNPVQLCSLAPM